MRYKDETVPCYKCEKRHSGCHSNCPDYAQYRKDTTERNEAIRKSKAETEIFNSVHVKAVQKVRKSKKGAKYWKRY